MKFPEKFRNPNPHPMYKNNPGDKFGFFEIPGRHANGRELRCLADDGHITGWEHVSVSVPASPKKCPSWTEMCIVKDLFWDEQELVVQYHPPKSDHVNMHKGCLHLWRLKGEELKAPPSILVGVRGRTTRVKL